MERIAMLESGRGGRTSIHYDGGLLEPRLKDGSVDAYIVACEDGWSPLGGNKRVMESELRNRDASIEDLAYWNRFENPDVTLVTIPARSPDSRLKGVVLCPSETSMCYRPFLGHAHGLPYRNFYYGVTYEAIAYAVEAWGAKRIAISHLSGSGNFHPDIATCNAEALAHFCDESRLPVESFTFLGCCINPRMLGDIRRLNPDGERTRHRPIAKRYEQKPGHMLIHLDIPGHRRLGNDALAA